MITLYSKKDDLTFSGIKKTPEGALFVLMFKFYFYISYSSSNKLCHF